MNYIGSKQSLLSFIENVIYNNVPDINHNMVICDLFSGTGSVAKHFKQKGFNIIANDIQYYSYCLLKHYIENNNILLFNNLNNIIHMDPFQYLNNIIAASDGFIYLNYSPNEYNNYQRKYYTI